MTLAYNHKVLVTDAVAMLVQVVNERTREWLSRNEAWKMGEAGDMHGEETECVQNALRSLYLVTSQK